MKMILFLACLLSMGCLTRTEVLYASPAKRPENLNGFMRLAQRKVRVVVEGSDRVAEFIIHQPGDMLLVKDSDVSAMVAKIQAQAARIVELKNAR